MIAAVFILRHHFELFLGIQWRSNSGVHFFVTIAWEVGSVRPRRKQTKKEKRMGSRGLNLFMNDFRFFGNFSTYQCFCWYSQTTILCAVFERVSSERSDSMHYRVTLGITTSVTGE